MFIFNLVLSLIFVVHQSLAAEPSSEILLDVRTPSEYSQVHIEDSLNVDFRADNFKDQVEKLDRSKSYKIYCGSGNRAGKAVTLMKSMGFKEVTNAGGIADVAKSYKKTCVGPQSEKCK